MCGVIGYLPGDPSQLDEDVQETMFERLMLESRVRGTHAFGIYTRCSGDFFCARSHILDEVIKHFCPSHPAIAHCRYSTSGDWQNLDNCQPIVVESPDGVTRALAFNGIVHMGTREEFEAAFGVRCDSDNDGEVFLRMLENYGLVPCAGGTEVMEPREAIAATDIVQALSGSFAGVWLRVDPPGWATGNALDDPPHGVAHMYVARNARRPLWVGEWFGATWYASTRDIMMRAGFHPDCVMEVPVGAWKTRIKETK